MNIKRQPSKFSSKNLTIALLYNQLKEVAPGLVEQFEPRHKFQKMELKLGDVVNVFIQSKQTKN